MQNLFRKFVQKKLGITADNQVASLVRLDPEKAAAGQPQADADQYALVLSDCDVLNNEWNEAVGKILIAAFTSTHPNTGVDDDFLEERWKDRLTTLKRNESRLEKAPDPAALALERAESDRRLTNRTQVGQCCDCGE